MRIKPYPFQHEAITAFFEYCRDNPGLNPVLEMPTGSGKSVVIAAICEVFAKAGKKVLVLTRQKELIVQNSKRLHELAGDISIGWYCDGLGEKVLGRDVTFATIQSVAKKGYEIGQCNLIIIDEAQQVPHSSRSQYVTFIETVKKCNPALRVLGLTATPYRLSSGLIYGEDKLFDGLAHAVPLKKMLDQGAITGWRLPEVEPVDMSEVSIRGKDFDLDSMGDAFMEKLKSNVAEILGASKGRKKCLCFATTVLHAMALARAIEETTGEHVGIITGAMEKHIRAEKLEKFVNGNLRWLVNCEVLTTGFDAPNIDLIALCRATQSHSLFYQILGRGMRTSPGKEYFDILDFGGNFDRLGDPRDPNFGRPEEEPDRIVCPHCDEFAMAEDVVCSCCDKPLKFRECPTCFTEVPYNVRLCPGKIVDPEMPLIGSACGRDLWAKRCKGTTQTGAGPEKCDKILGTDEEMCSVCATEVERKTHGEFEANAKRPEMPETFSVLGVSYNVHRPKDAEKPPSMRVTYLVEPIDPEARGDLMRQRVNEWVCLEHMGFARQKAVLWWKQRSRNPPPDEIFEACGLAARGAVTDPQTITVVKNGKWQRVVSVTFPEGSEKGWAEIEEEEEAPF